MNSEYSLPISISHTQHEKHIRTKHTIENPILFDIDKISDDYITNQSKIFFYFLLNVILN